MTTKANSEKKSTAKRTSKATARILHRVNESLSGADLFSYTCAVFAALGLTGKNAKGTKIGNVSAFYNSASIIRHHTANKNFAREDGMLVLTAKGKAHFASRFNDDSAQFVDRKENASILKAIKSGKTSDLPSEWRSAVTFSPVTIK